MYQGAVAVTTGKDERHANDRTAGRRRILERPTQQGRPSLAHPDGEAFDLDRVGRGGTSAVAGEPCVAGHTQFRARLTAHDPVEGLEHRAVDAPSGLEAAVGATASDSDGRIESPSRLARL